MTDQKHTKDGHRFEEAGGLSFRGMQGQSDYPLLLDINRSSRQADKNDQAVSLEDITRAFAQLEGLDPGRDVLIAVLDEAPYAIGYSRLGWYSGGQNTRLYYQVSFLRQEFRGRGVWQAMVRQNERRLREIAAEHPHLSQRFFQAWASDNQVDWILVLESTGYLAVRRFNNMLYRLDQVPTVPIPAGIEIRPVRPEHMRSIWEAQKEMNKGLFENVAEDWLEEKYPAWLENSSHTPQFWQVAWDGDQLAGMVLAHLDEKENKERKQKRGYTEHIYVRPRWRKRGLASALLAQSLQVLQEQGMLEAELGVDSENESAAFSLYQRMGYRTFSIDTWFRKTME
jgi:mycothiol synthase